MSSEVPTSEAGLTDQTARAFFDRYFELLNEHDVRHVPVLYTPDIEFHSDELPEIVTGHSGMERVLSAIWRAFPDWRFDVLEGPYVSADGRHAALRVRVGGRMTGPFDLAGFAPTGRPLTIEFGGFYEIEGDRVKRARIILDVNRVAIQMGAAPPPGSGGAKLALVIQRLTAWRMRRQRRA
jgi:predicted ester cyclase